MKKRIYELECSICGDILVDINIWEQCLKEGCDGVYRIVWECPAGI